MTRSHGLVLSLALLPGQAGRLPTTNGTAMPLVVKRSFETATDIMAGAIPRRRHRLGRSQAPASRTANEEEIVIY